MKILYIGESKTYKLYKKGVVPSHWLYCAVEMQKDGHDVVWENESSRLWNDLKLVLKYRPQIIFIPNLNLRNHLFLLFLSALGFVRTPICAFLHHEPKVKRGIKYYVYSLLLSAPKHIFFLSTKTMQETCCSGLVKYEKCSVPIWGPDVNFYDKVATKTGDYFISTGKENRDFDILIEAFKRTGAPLKIITAKQHAESNYENLVEKCRGIQNIEVVLTENSGDVYPQMLDAMANAKALVCPLRKDKLNYCVGLSTIADAIGLHKPLIITNNPYHDTCYIGDFNIVNDLKDWENAIIKLNYKSCCKISIDNCYINIKEAVGL